MTILPKGTEAASHYKIPKPTEEWGGTEGLAEVTDETPCGSCLTLVLL